MERPDTSLMDAQHPDLAGGFRLFEVPASYESWFRQLGLQRAVAGPSALYVALLLYYATPMKQGPRANLATRPGGLGMGTAARGGTMGTRT